MKNEKLLDASEEIDEERIEEATLGNKAQKKKAKTAAWVKCEIN